MAPTTLPDFYHSFNLATLVQKRSNSCEVNYSSQCSTHRTVLLIVSIFVGSFLFIGFAISCIIKRGRNKAIKHAQAMSGYPAGELRLITDEAGFPVVARVAVAGTTRDGDLGRMEPNWMKGDAGDERGAKRNEAPPPYMPMTPDAARIRS